MKTVILYKTKNGSTKEYADFLKSQSKDSEICDIDDFNMSLINSFDKVIIGSATYGGQIIALNFLTKNWERLKEKEVFLFTVGMMDPKSKSSMTSYETIPQNIRNNIKYIKVPGRLNEDRLSFIQKLMVKVIKAPLVDKVDFRKIEPVLNFIKH